MSSKRSFNNKINIKLFLLCPVPEDQKPINEYLDLVSNPITSFLNKFSWFLFQKNLFTLFKKLSKNPFSIFILIILPFLFKFTSFNLNYLRFIFPLIVFFKIISVSASFLFFLILFRWIEVDKRFNNAQVFYEEGSWYDGQIWEKPLTIIRNDKLISRQKIQPKIRRSLRTFFLCFLIYLYFVYLIF